MKALCVTIVWAVLAAFAPALAQDVAAPDIALADARQEARAQALFQDIRCVVCQHESIEASPAGIAGDLRRLVRERISAGATDAQIRDELVTRYGDFVLFSPPLRASTALLWLAPAGILLGGLGVFAVWTRRRREAVEPLSEAEEIALAQRLRPDSDATSPNGGR